MQVYLDNNATTMTDSQVVEAMQPFFSEIYGNPSSLHKFGTASHPYLRKAIDQVYTALNASDDPAMADAANMLDCDKNGTVDDPEVAYYMANSSCDGY